MTDISQNAATQDSELIEKIEVTNMEVPRNDIELKSKKTLAPTFKITTMEDLRNQNYHEDESLSEDDREFNENHLTTKVKIGWKQLNLEKQHEKSNRTQNAKYTALNCVPLALFEEIVKPLHLYFIITTLLSFVPDSPKQPLWNLISLILVILLKVFINIYVDIGRRRLD